MDAVALAQRFGTPLVIYDLDTLDASIARITAAAERYGIEVSYAGKAFLCVAFARYLHERGIGIDVSSLGEFETARRADIPPEALTLHGCMKSDAEISLVVDGFVGRSVVDGCEELARTIERDSSQQPAPILLRLNTGIAAATHRAIRTAGEASKFGIAPDAEPEALALLRRAQGRVRFLGLHAHLGSQIDDSAAFIEHALALVDAAARFTEAGFPVPHIVLGGGFVGDPEPILAACIPSMRDRAARHGIAFPSIGIEPGRAIVAAAAMTVLRIGAIKRTSQQRIAICDGGLYENPRHALYGATHPLRVLSAVGEASEPTLLCGRSCESDELGTYDLPLSLKAGDAIALLDTGAYTASMASTYNRFARPAVVAVRGDDVALWMRAESLDETVARDVRP